MSDEVDDLLRGAMKTLDGEVPSGYFEALPNRTLARLEASSMQMGTEGNVDETNPVMQGIPRADQSARAEDPSAIPARPSQPPREEDSGLHDIRSLASSTKLRLSKRSITIPPEEDILASSSASWKAVALPEPARMVSLPEIAELPVGSEVEPKRGRRESKRQMQEAAAAAAAAPVVSAIATTPVTSGPSAGVATSMPAFGSGMLAKQSRSSRAALFTALGVGLAAAAGAVIFVSTKDKSTPAQEATPATQQAAAVKPTVESIEPAAATTTSTTGTADTAAAGAVAPEAPAAIAAAPVEPAPAETKAAEVEEKRVSRGKAAKVATKEKLELAAPKDAAKSPTKSKPEKPTTVIGGTAVKKEQENEQSFDDLLKEAGVKDPKKADKPVLEKKSLSSDDIRKGMASVQSKAQACYAGTQGTASVKLTVAPSGQVTKATVSGVFAGTPVGACVASAVKSISFPPWDGGPQSVNYSYLLAE